MILSCVKWLERTRCAVFFFPRVHSLVWIQCLPTGRNCNSTISVLLNWRLYSSLDFSMRCILLSMSTFTLLDSMSSGGESATAAISVFIFLNWQLHERRFFCCGPDPPHHQNLGLMSLSVSRMHLVSVDDVMHARRKEETKFATE